MAFSARAPPELREHRRYESLILWRMTIMVTTAALVTMIMMMRVMAVVFSTVVRTSIIE